MKKLITICFLVILGAGSPVFANYTSQIWHFDNDLLMPDPDFVDNGPGIGQATLYVTPGPGGGWANGAWELSGEIDVIVENNPALQEKKTIHIELIWMAGVLDSFLPKEPGVGVQAIPIDMMDKMEMSVAHDPIAGTDYTLSVYDITIWPNPPREWIFIKGNIVVDDLKIETRCIPEPATMGLLGLGSLALLRYRRKR